jgi:hypothetical protein
MAPPVREREEKDTTLTNEDSTGVRTLESPHQLVLMFACHVRGEKALTDRIAAPLNARMV